MDLERIESLLKLMQDYRVAELGLDGDDGSIHISLMHDGAQVAAAPQVVQSIAAPAAPAPEAAPAASSDSYHEMKSPMVGTFYTAPKPGSPAFVKVGDVVSVGQVLCIVEAMKLMNEIESEVSGTVREIALENADPVQFGQVLFRIEPN